MTNDTLTVTPELLVYQCLTWAHSKFNHMKHMPRQKFNHYHLKPNLKSTFKCYICLSHLLKCNEFLIY